MKAQEPTHQEIARSKLAAAARLIGDACHLLGKDIIALRVHRIDQGQSAAAIVREPSHAPTRHPVTPLSTIPRSSPHEWPEQFEHELRSIAARKWSEKTGHDPAFQHADCCLIWEKTIHHPGCCTHNGRVGCDCGPVFLKRFGGLTFAVQPDGALDPFVEPTPSPEKFRTDALGFWRDSAWSVADWFFLATADTLEFSTAGSGDSERFLELPHESDIETRKAPES